MDNKRFDSLTKALASGQSRRSVIKGLLGLGGAAAVSTVVTDGTDARRRSNITLPAAPTTTTAAPCRDGFEPCTTSVTGCCAICSGNTPVTCGLECCASDDQCCDGECCGGDQLCVAKVLGCSNSRCEEICCDEDQICDGRCCNGTCFQPLGGVIPADDDDDDGRFDRDCCPRRATYCPWLKDDRFGVCCDGDTPVCCQDENGYPICIREDQCCTASDCPGLEGQGEEACWNCRENTCVPVPRGDQGGCVDCWGCSGIQECVVNPTANGDSCGEGGFCCDGTCEPNTNEVFYCEATNVCCDTVSEACCDVDGCCGGVCFGGQSGRDSCCPTSEGKLFCSTAQECCEDASTEKCCGSAGCCAGQCFDNDNACCPSDTSFVCTYRGLYGDDDDDDDDDACCTNDQNCCGMDGCCTGSCNDAGRCCVEGQTFACGPDCCDNATENCCGDYCANLWSDDSENCGACGNVCGECETCSGGTCVPREGSCSDGGTCVAGVCTYDLPIFKSDGSTLIDGACFTLYEGACGPNGAPVRSEQCVGPADAQDGSNGRTIFTDLPAGDYCVVETTVPQGYTGGGPVSVNLPANTSGWTVINRPEPTTTTPQPTTTTPEPICPGQVQCSGANANCCATEGQCAPNGDCCATDRIICGDVCCQGPCDTCVDGQCVSNLDDASACSDPRNSYASGICCNGACNSSGATTCAPPTTTQPPCVPNCDCSDPNNAGLTCNGYDPGVAICFNGWCVFSADICGENVCGGNDECETCIEGECVLINQGGSCNGDAGICQDEWCV